MAISDTISVGALAQIPALAGAQGNEANRQEGIAADVDFTQREDYREALASGRRQALSGDIAMLTAGFAPHVLAALGSSIAPTGIKKGELGPPIPDPSGGILRAVGKAGATLEPFEGMLGKIVGAAAGAPTEEGALGLETGEAGLEREKYGKELEDLLSKIYRER